MHGTASIPPSLFDRVVQVRLTFGETMTRGVSMVSHHDVAGVLRWIALLLHICNAKNAISNYAPVELSIPTGQTSGNMQVDISCTPMPLSMFGPVFKGNGTHERRASSVDALAVDGVTLTLTPAPCPISTLTRLMWATLGMRSSKRIRSAGQNAGQG